MNEKMRKVLMVLFGVVFICSFGMFLYQTIESKKGADIYLEAERLAYSDDIPGKTGSEDTEENDGSGETEIWQEETVENDYYIPILERTNLAALRNVNTDVLGWIGIPGTKLSYPFVQGEDNDYYLNRTWNRESSIVGSVFMEHLNRSDFSDYHTIIYAHHMMDGTMFGSLRDYKDPKHLEKNPYIYIYDDRGAHRYEIFSIYEAYIESNTYRIGFKDDEDKREFLDECIKQSIYKIDVVPSINDRILTLSTCTNTGGYSTRWVVQARLKAMKN